MKSGRSLSLSALLLNLLLLAYVTDATSPLDVDVGLYHASHQWAGARECTAIRLPTQMCPACLLKPFKGSGPNLNFGGVNRFDIYDLTLPKCIEGIEEYLTKNPCDDKRADAWETYIDPDAPRRKREAAYRTMIYFMYSVCETCCDCIPIGSRVNQYESRKRRGKLISVRRGNCAAHYWYDTCKIWPNVGLITSENGNLNKRKWPPCDHFKRWINSPDSKGWLRNSNTKGLTWRMRKLMTDLMTHSTCADETQWKNCVRMEKAQNRV